MTKNISFFFSLMAKEHPNLYTWCLFDTWCTCNVLRGVFGCLTPSPQHFKILATPLHNDNHLLYAHTFRVQYKISYIELLKTFGIKSP